MKPRRPALKGGIVLAILALSIAGGVLLVAATPALRHPPLVASPEAQRLMIVRVVALLDALVASIWATVAYKRVPWANAPLAVAIGLIMALAFNGPTVAVPHVPTGVMLANIAFYTAGAWATFWLINAAQLQNAGIFTQCALGFNALWLLLPGSKAADGLVALMMVMVGLVADTMIDRSRFGDVGPVAAPVSAGPPWPAPPPHHYEMPVAGRRPDAKLDYPDYPDDDLRPRPATSWRAPDEPEGRATAVRRPHPHRGGPV